MRSRKCKNWQEAHVMFMGVKGLSKTRNYKEYLKICESNPRLLVFPYRYPDFPGLEIFLGINYYKTVAEASEAVRKIVEIVSPTTYTLFHNKDPRLPPLPQKFYENFRGWEIFLFGWKSVYATWQEASEAAIALGIDYKYKYKPNFKRDSKLPRHPEITYSDFPGWPIFLGKNKP